jgi:hypothetical protein
MSAPQWNGFGEELALRRFIRKFCPRGGDGFVAEDLDLVARRFTPSDPHGRFCLIEHKYGDVPLGTSKFWTFGMLDAVLRVGDPNMGNYRGFFVLRTPKPATSDLDDDPIFNPRTFFNVNDVDLTRDQFIAWLCGEDSVAPLEPSGEFPHVIEHLRAYTSRYPKKGS